MPSSIRRSFLRILSGAGVLALGACADSPAPLAVDGAPPALATAPAGSQVQAFAGNGQVAVAGDTVPSLLVARVVNGSGVPVKGVTVQWTITSGGGTLVVAGGYTNETGRAYARWKLGTTVGTQTLRVDAAGAGSASFSARAIPANSQLQVLSGNGQSAPPDSRLPQPLRVRLVEATGTPIPNAQVIWTVVAGGGTLGEGAASTTDTEGVAVNAWQLGPLVGEQRVRATVRGLAPVEFTAAAVVAGTTLAIYAGNGQTGTQYDTLARELVVRVARADGTPIEGVTVSWAAANTYAGMRSERTVTNSEGLASNLWRLGKPLGTQTATATVAGVGTVTFTATVVANARTLTIVSGSGQSGLPGDTLLQPLVMRVVDPAGYGIRGVKVTWTVVLGGSVQTASNYTDAGGYATNRWILGSRQTGQQVRAAVTGSGEVVFTATAGPATGPQIAYRSNRAGGSNVFAVAPDGTRRYVINAGVAASEPDWSPDGTRLVFTANADIWTMNADGSGAAPLLTLAGVQGQPAWSPAGGKILFSGAGPSGTGLYTVNVNGTGLTLVRGGAFDAAWSPDGTRIVYRSSAGSGIMNADGTNPVAFSIGMAPSWSPDGTRIAYYLPNTTCACDDGTIWVVPVAGGPAVALGAGAEPDWSPDGSRIAFVNYYELNNYHVLGVMNADGTNRVVVDNGFIICSPAWKPVP